MIVTQADIAQVDDNQLGHVITRLARLAQDGAGDQAAQLMLAISQALAAALEDRQETEAFMEAEYLNAGIEMGEIVNSPEDLKAMLEEGDRMLRESLDTPLLEDDDE